MTRSLEAHLMGQTERARSSFWHDVRALAVIDLLVPGRAGQVADLGAGAGFLGRQLTRERPEVGYRFFEPLEPLANHLEAVFGSRARLASVDEVSGADVVALLDVIEHVEDDEAFLADVVSRMDPGSRIVVTVPALPVLWSSWDEQLGHHRRYTRSSIAALVAPLPLEVAEIRYLFPELLAPALLRKVLRRGSKAPEVSRAEFPRFPALVDRTMRIVSTGTYRLRRFWPFGTSLVLVGAARPG